MAQNTGPLNIARLVALNDKYSIAEDYDRKISKTNIVCRWHERAFQDQFQRRNPIPSHVNPKALTSNSAGISGEEREMMTEMLFFYCHGEPHRGDPEESPPAAAAARGGSAARG